MSPPTKRSRPAGNGTADVQGDGLDQRTRLAAVDPVTVRALALVVPCSLCTAGLCLRCWVVARAAEQLTIAGRVDQSADDLTWAVAA